MCLHNHNIIISCEYGATNHACDNWANIGYDSRYELFEKKIYYHAVPWEPAKILWKANFHEWGLFLELFTNRFFLSANGDYIKKIWLDLTGWKKVKANVQLFKNSNYKNQRKHKFSEYIATKYRTWSHDRSDSPNHRPLNPRNSWPDPTQRPNPLIHPTHE